MKSISWVRSPRNLLSRLTTGPHPRWTPKILDILQREKCPCIVLRDRRRASKSPGLLRRDNTAEGHSIGNHTYTHPVYDEISPTQLRWELNLTQRLIESTLGVKSILFRPPYDQPEYAEEVGATSDCQDMGYLIVGQKIDPHDRASPTASRCRRRKLSTAFCSKPIANIILFHDGGGDRSQTVAALPVIIDELRAAASSSSRYPRC